MVELNKDIVSHSAQLEYLDDGIIEYNINYIPNSDHKALFVFIHGFKAFKDWGFYPYLCQRIAQLGIASLRFSFSNSGVINSDNLTYDVEKFSRNNTTRELSETKYLLEKILNNQVPLPNDCNISNKIYLCGHSKGAAISLLVANKFTNISRVTLISPIFSFDRHSDRQKAHWKSKELFEFTISETKQKLFIPYSYLSDIIDNDYDSLLVSEISNLNIPLQIIHGKQDKTVPISESYNIAYNYKNKQHLKFDIIQQSGHSFGATHPLRKSTAILEETIDRIIDFIRIDYDD